MQQTSNSILLQRRKTTLLVFSHNKRLVLYKAQLTISKNGIVLCPQYTTADWKNSWQYDYGVVHLETNEKGQTAGEALGTYLTLQVRLP